MVFKHFVLFWGLLAGLLAWVKPVAVAQQNLEVQQWQFGKVYLTHGDTLTGNITYYRREDALKLVQPGQPVHTISPVMASGFAVQDNNALTYKEFRTILWNRNNDPGGFKSPAFFELLHQGPYSLLKRETVVRVNNGQRYGYNPYGPPGAVREFYEIQDLVYLYTPDEKSNIPPESEKGPAGFIWEPEKTNAGFRKRKQPELQ